MTVKTERRTATIEEEIVVEVRCDGCDAVLESVFKGSDDQWETIQPEGALTVMVDGGHGMFWDNPDEKPLAFVLCRTCSGRLLETFPAIRVAIDKRMKENMEELGRH